MWAKPAQGATPQLVKRAPGASLDAGVPWDALMWVRALEELQELIPIATSCPGWQPNATSSFPWPEMLVGLCGLTQGSHLGLCRGHRTASKTQHEPQRELEHHPWAALSQAAARSVASATSKCQTPPGPGGSAPSLLMSLGTEQRNPPMEKPVSHKNSQSAVQGEHLAVFIFILLKPENAVASVKGTGTTADQEETCRHLVPAPRGEEELCPNTAVPPGSVAQPSTWHGPTEKLQFIPLPEPPTRKARGEEQSGLAGASIQLKGL